MAVLLNANFDNWIKTPENKQELRKDGESIYWNKLDRLESCEIYRNFESPPIYDFEYSFDFKLDKIENISETNRTIIRFLWIGNNFTNFISIYPEQRIGSNSGYGLVFHQQVDGNNSDNHFRGGPTLAVSELYRAKVYREGTKCGFLIFSGYQNDPIISFEQTQWDSVPYIRASFARLDGYNDDLRDWSTGEISSVEIRHSPYPFEKDQILDEENSESSIGAKFVVNHQLRGLDGSISNDVSTSEDELGYDIYAQAIYRFITHQNTTPPITISIQSPWGGGKTSLMKMIQKRLDPIYHKKQEERLRTENKKMSIWDALKIINMDEKTPTISNPENNDQRITLWFNAWMYSSTEEAWAGNSR